MMQSDSTRLDPRREREISRRQGLDGNRAEPDDKDWFRVEEAGPKVYRRSLLTRF